MYLLTFKRGTNIKAENEQAHVKTVYATAKAQVSLRICTVLLEHTIYEPAHDKTNKMTCAPSEDSDQPAYPPSLISLRCPHEETSGS